MEPRSLVAAIDQGTTSSRCILFDRAGRSGRQPPAGARPDHAATRLGRARRRRDPRARADLRPGRAARHRRRRARARRGRHQRPARDDRRLVATRPGRPVAQRDRLAGHPDRGRRASACAAGDPRGMDRFRALTGLPISTYSSALKLAWILDDGGPERRAAAEARRPAASGPSTRWLIWHLTGGAERRRPRDRRDERVADDADGPRDRSPGSPELLDAIGVPAAMLPEIRSLVRGLRDWASGTWPACRSRAISATSRRRCSARPASRRARSSAPTAPAVSCSCTRASGRSTRRHGLITTVAARLGRRARDVRPRGLGRGRRLAHPVAARQPRHHRRRVRGREARPLRAGQRRRRLRARRSPGCSRRTGGATRAGVIAGLTRYASRGQHRTRRARVDRLPGLRPRRRDGRPTSARHFPASCGWTAG